jgi:hypothetical protein
MQYDDFTVAYLFLNKHTRISFLKG